MDNARCNFFIASSLLEIYFHTFNTLDIETLRLFRYPVTDSVLFYPFCVNNCMLIWIAAHLVECDFEHGITSGKCNLQQLHDDQFDWTLKTGPSGVSGSGPLADHTNGAGKFKRLFHLVYNL